MQRSTQEVISSGCSASPEIPASSNSTRCSTLHNQPPPPSSLVVVLSAIHNIPMVPQAVRTTGVNMITHMLMIHLRKVTLQQRLLGSVVL